MTPDIVATRIDNRLIHGQVANLWLSQALANLCVVVDDETANDKILQDVMRMTADTKGIGVRFFSVEKTIAVIGNAAPSQHIYIITKTPKVIRQLVEAGVPIKSVNIGNMHFSEGKHRYKEDHVYVDNNDLDDLAYLKEKGVEMFIQIMPNSTRIDI